MKFLFLLLALCLVAAYPQEWQKQYSPEEHYPSQNDGFKYPQKANSRQAQIIIAGCNDDEFAQRYPEYDEKVCKGRNIQYPYGNTCMCKEGTIRASTDNKTCITLEECHNCYDDEVYHADAGNTISYHDTTCGNKYQSGRGDRCFCKQGTYRVSEINNKCVSRSECEKMQDTNGS